MQKTNSLRLKGEMEFGENGALFRWNNTSGTYKCANNKAYQAGLPLDKLWVVSGGYAKSETNPKYEKVLMDSEEELLLEQTRWQKMLAEYLHSNPEAQSSHDTLLRMVEQRQNSVKTYGYGCRVEPVDSLIARMELQDKNVRHEIARMELAYTTEAELLENEAELDCQEITRTELASNTEAERPENQAELDRRENTRMELASTTEAKSAENQVESEHHREIRRIELASTTNAESAENHREITRMELASTNESGSVRSEITRVKLASTKEVLSLQCTVQ